MYELPTSITIREASFGIRDKGDFRMVLDCFSALNDVELSKQERIYASLIIFYEDLNDLEDISKLPDVEEAVKKMFDFFNCGQEEEKKTSYKLLDWDKDSMLICSAVNNVAQKEIRSESYVHWWTFMGYYMAIGECTLSTIVNIRYKIVNQKPLEKHEKQFRYENPQYFNWDYKSIQEKEDDEFLMNMWNGGE